MVSVSDVKTTRNYKDTLFGSLFYSCDEAIENAKALYKALTGKDVENVEKCRLEDVLFRQFMNDVAYIMDGVFICFVEHQSTINPNMALRLLIYLARTYERFYTGDDLYKSTFKLDKYTLKLSDAFKSKTDCPKLELEVKVIDINYDKMQETDLKNCKILSEYSFMVDTVRKYNGDVERAVKECIEKGVLVDYLRHYGSEVVNMLFEEYNAEKALEIKGKEEYEKGLNIGKAEGKALGKKEGEELGRLKTLAGLVKDGLLSLAEAAKRAGMTPTDFEIRTVGLA